MSAIAVAEVVLDEAEVAAFVGEHEAAGVACEVAGKGRTALLALRNLPPRKC